MGTIIFPSTFGAMNWGGASYDPMRSLVLVNTTRLAAGGHSLLGTKMGDYVVAFALP